MGALATAGIISGAGNAMSGSLMETQRGLTAAFMQSERDKFEGERMKMHLASNERLQLRNQDFQRGEGNRTRDHQSLLQSTNQTFLAGQQGERLQAETGMHEDKLAVERTKLREEAALKVEELGIKSKDQLAHQRYYEGIIETYKQGLRGGKGAAGSAMKDLSERDKQMVLVNDKMIDGLQKQLLDPNTTPDLATGIQAQIDKLYTHSMRVLGHVEPPPAPEPTIKDRYKKSSETRTPGLLQGTRTIQERNESLRQGP